MNIIETFLSIQGEGIHAGLPTYFVRLAGCNLRCSYCDTKYSYGQGKKKTVTQIISVIKKQPFQFICITGGEPLLQNETKELITKLTQIGYQIDIETNGSVPIDQVENSSQILFSLDIKCPSSGMTKSMHYENLKLLQKKDQVKFIIGDKRDYDFSKNVIKKYKLFEKTNVIFTPTGGTEADHLVRWILKDKLAVRIGLQLHKFIWKSEREELNLI
ncbi:MAG: radical SAM protein [Parcubacteria group bacterium]|jgi:7-carboxy-7-deazaguanine synthase